jgi:hypothetical protein
VYSIVANSAAAATNRSSWCNKSLTAATEATTTATAASFALLALFSFIFHFHPSALAQNGSTRRAEQDDMLKCAIACVSATIQGYHGLTSKSRLTIVL